MDRIVITIPSRTASLKRWRDSETLPKSLVVYPMSEYKHVFKAAVLASGIKFSRDMGTVIQSADATRTVVLPSTVWIILNNAFDEARALRSAVLNRGLKQITQAAFSGSKLRSVAIPSSVISVLDNAFSRCDELRRVTFEDGIRLEEIERGCFANSGIKEITIPRSVTTIKEWAFSGCASLKRVCFQEGSALQCVLEHGFANCGLEEIQLPAGVAKIEEEAFSWCERLKLAVLGEGLETLGRRAFFQSGLESLVLPGSLLLIDKAFCGCRNLKNIDLPAGRLSLSYDLC